MQIRVNFTIAGLFVWLKEFSRMLLTQPRLCAISLFKLSAVNFLWHGLDTGQVLCYRSFLNSNEEGFMRDAVFALVTQFLQLIEWDVLAKCTHVGVLGRNSYRAPAGSVCQHVLAHVLLRTLRFSKASEEITCTQIKRGFPKILITPVDRGISTIRRALQILHASGLITRNNEDVSPNVVEILRAIRSSERFRQLTPFEQRHFANIESKILNSIRRKNNGHRFVPANGGTSGYSEDTSVSSHMRDGVNVSFHANGVSGRTDELVRMLANAYASAQNVFWGNGDGFMPLADEISNVVERTRSRAQQRNADLAASSFYTPRGDPKPLNLLAYFDSVCREAFGPEHYFSERKTRKLLGMASYYLRTAIAEGMTEDDVRERIRHIVSNWSDLAGRIFVVDGISKSNMPYQAKRTVPPVPNFVFYFSYVNHLMSMLAAPKDVSAESALDCRRTGPQLIS